jgi:hypothetical protein
VDDVEGAAVEAAGVQLQRERKAIDSYQLFDQNQSFVSEW